MRAEKFKTVCSNDPEIDTTRISADAFVEWIRERTDLSAIAHCFTPAGPTKFNIREIPRNAWPVVDSASSDEEKYRRAFLYGVESVENIVQRDGTRIAKVGGGKAIPNGAQQVDAFAEADLTYFWPEEIQEIGRVAYEHSFFHPKTERHFRLPPMSHRRLAERVFLSAEQSPTSPASPSSESSASEAP
jgi:hypothetical protein